MKHLFIYAIIIALVTVYMVYKLLEVFINAPLGEDEKLNYQLDMWKTKRLLLEKIRI